MRRMLCTLGQQGYCIYAQDRYGMIFHWIAPHLDWKGNVPPEEWRGTSW